MDTSVMLLPLLALTSLTLKEFSFWLPLKKFTWVAQELIQYCDVLSKKKPILINLGLYITHCNICFCYFGWLFLQKVTWEWLKLSQYCNTLPIRIPDYLGLSLSLITIILWVFSFDYSSWWPRILLERLLGSWNRRDKY